VQLVVGLGNPGEEYAPTRHNVGFRVVELLARDAGEDFGRERFQSRVAEVRLGEKKVMLLKPQTFMNNSGRAARAALGFYKLEPADMLVVCDDYNLELGRLRARRGGSAGGHNGLESIIAELGTQSFPRLRLGIGAARGDTVSYVLGRFRAEEREAISETIVRAADAVRSWVREGIESCMNRFNAAPPAEEEPREDRGKSEEAN
jgi:PTH1 family peptidyl-tRNA hydrolase